MQKKKSFARLNWLPRPKVSKGLIVFKCNQINGVFLTSLFMEIIALF